MVWFWASQVQPKGKEQDCQGKGKKEMEMTDHGCTPSWTGRDTFIEEILHVDTKRTADSRNEDHSEVERQVY